MWRYWSDGVGYGPRMTLLFPLGRWARQLEEMSWEWCIVVQVLDGLQCYSRCPGTRFTRDSG